MQYNLSSTTAEWSIKWFWESIPVVSRGLTESFSFKAQIAAAAATATLCITMAISPCIRLWRLRHIDSLHTHILGSCTRSRAIIIHIYLLAVSINIATLIPVLGSKWLILNNYSLRYLFPLYLTIITGIIISSSLAISVLFKIAQKENAPQALLVLIGLMASFYIGWSRPWAPDILTYRDISRVEPVFSFIKSQNSANYYLGGSYWLCWPLKALSIFRGNEIGILTNRSRFDPMSDQMEKKLVSDINIGKDFTFLCLSESDVITDVCYWGPLQGIRNNPANKWSIATRLVFSSKVEKGMYLHKMIFRHQV